MFQHVTEMFLHRYHHGIIASATIATPEMFQHVTEMFSDRYCHELTGVNMGKHLFLQEALQRLPNAEACAGRRIAAQREIIAAKELATKIREK